MVVVVMLLQVGGNGTGKTTLLKLLMGDLRPVSGVHHAHRSLRIGYFSQHHVDQLDMNVSAVQVLEAKFPGLYCTSLSHSLHVSGLYSTPLARTLCGLFTQKVTQTHTFNGPLSRTTRVSLYQKGKTNLDFTEARDSEWQWHQLGHMQVYT